MSQELYAREMEKLKRGVELLVATPGKAEDLLAEGMLQLNDTQVRVSSTGIVASRNRR
jgi:superfamily II DNA/RNA helicase